MDRPPISEERRAAYLHTMQKALREADQVVWSQFPQEIRPDVDFLVGHIQIVSQFSENNPENYIHPNVRKHLRKKLIADSIAYDKHSRTVETATGSKEGIEILESDLPTTPPDFLRRIIYHEAATVMQLQKEIQIPYADWSEREHDEVADWKDLIKKSYSIPIPYEETHINEAAYVRTLRHGPYEVLALNATSTQIEAIAEIGPVLFEFITEQALLRRGDLQMLEADLKLGKVKPPQKDVHTLFIAKMLEHLRNYPSNYMILMQAYLSGNLTDTINTLSPVYGNRTSQLFIQWGKLMQASELTAQFLGGQSKFT